MCSRTVIWRAGLATSPRPRLPRPRQQANLHRSTNVAGTVWPIRAAVPHFLSQGGGDIVIVASVAGLLAARRQKLEALRAAGLDPFPVGVPKPDATAAGLAAAHGR